MRLWVPVAEIEFAARFGFLTKALWLNFFEVGGRTSKYVRWQRLCDRGFFKPHPASRSDDVLVLNAANVRRICLSEPVLPPPIAQVRHDEIAAHGTLKLEQNNHFSDIQTEAQLKRFGFEWSQRREKYPDLALRLGEEKLEDIVVPKRYFKAVLSEDDDGSLRAYGFIATVGVKGPVSNFKTSIDQIEKETGYDLFAELPDQVEEKIELAFAEPKAVETKSSQ